MPANSGTIRHASVPTARGRGDGRSAGGTGRERLLRSRGQTFEAGIAQAMTAVLASPRFLFREEAVERGLFRPISAHR